MTTDQTDTAPIDSNNPPTPPPAPAPPAPVPPPVTPTSTPDISNVLTSLSETVAALPEQIIHAIRESTPAPPANDQPAAPANNDAGSQAVVDSQAKEGKGPSRLAQAWFGSTTKW